MRTRDVGFVLVGLGVGLSLSAVITVWMFSHRFIFGVTSVAGYLIISIPFVLVVSGILMIFGNRRVG